MDINYEEIKIPIVKTLYETILYTTPIILNLPKPIKFSYGETILQNLALVIDLANEANIELKLIKERQIVKAHAKIETTKIFVRILSEGKYISIEEYIKISKYLVDTSKMLYGWLQASKKN
ncbi:hypothetical protein A3C57_02855 [Candidatus Nomurabacteria bacterium RIFCSPHIGHO2_02_FULL_33_12]|uniref:Four helix bundle protein n=1 Tax=Candidatus Nomurabacteria bacterium RIFCSPLOWO2_01_FULL_33_17 TaxID=1801764 RepID=A0A1F6WMP8_9BACT|nr:MAG: hypothetical protein A3C57_02855 [Candidatus Nomurabacteria bacterium RIFCSPHIGHO2_02_FULL_33_12]OGI83160.1 MAG: hypothetical protein A2903_01795 [Candidatus Nomurabacteria bacterium RIFCSPLOWO2_01_FULL_33_17]